MGPIWLRQKISLFMKSLRYEESSLRTDITLYSGLNKENNLKTFYKHVLFYKVVTNCGDSSPDLI